MTIAPVSCAVEVRQSPADAFALFTGRIGEWWVGKGIGAGPRAGITLEPFAGGRWYETAEDGVVTPWGKVLAWEPPGRLLLVWELNSRFEPDPAVLTAIEIRFAATASGGTQISLEHRHLERFGVNAMETAGKIGLGWPKQLGGYAQFVAALAA